MACTRTYVRGRTEPQPGAAISRGDRTRTCNPRFWRPVHYQLCYSPVAPESLDPYAALRDLSRLYDRAMQSHTVYRTFNTEKRREFIRITEDVARGRPRRGHRRGHGARLRDAHHRRRLDQRRRAGPPGGRARVARQARAAELARAGERGRAGAAARSGRLPPPPRRRGQRRRAPEEPARPPPGDRPGYRRASSTSVRGSRSSTASSTAGGRSDS